MACDGPSDLRTPALPHEFPRRILLAVLDVTPQVLTETLAALAAPRDPRLPPFIPTAIHVVTTAPGRDRARCELLDPATGRFFRFCADHHLDPHAIEFDDGSFLVVRRDQRPLDDIIADDHTTAADTILGLVHRLTADDRAAVHASLSGGPRPTAFHLGHALSLYGRTQDRLSYLRFDHPFAATAATRHSAPPPRDIHDRKPAAHAADTRITLTDVPFLRLRELLPLPFIDELPPYRTASTDPLPLAPPLTLELHCRGHLLVAAGKTVHLPPADFAFYAVMVRRRASRKTFVRHDTPDLPNEYLREYMRATADHWSPNVVRVRRRLSKSANHDEWFEQRKARVNRALRSALGPWLGRACQIEGKGPRGETRFGVFVDPAHITIHD